VIRSAPSSPTAHLETSHLANLHDGVHLELQEYLAAGLSLRIDDTSTARDYLKRLERPRSTPLAASLARDAAGSIRAQFALRAGNLSEAARAFEEVQRLEARVGLIGGSPFYSQGLERYLYAGLMERLGRLEDAVQWYSSFSSNSIFDFVYLAPAHIARGRLMERMGRSREAAQHYTEALELYRGADPEFGRLVSEAQEGLNRSAQPRLSRRP
jgi:tetratricopeptide (TPR) repeat protein